MKDAAAATAAAAAAVAASSSFGGGEVEKDVDDFNADQAWESGAAQDGLAAKKWGGGSVLRGGAGEAAAYKAAGGSDRPFVNTPSHS